MRIGDFYTVLGVGPEASAEEIRRAYHRLALRYHPDKNPGDKRAEERFKELAAAYETLRDSRRRAEYDRLSASLKRARKSERATPRKKASSPSWSFGATRPKRPRRGRDLTHEISITLEEAHRGGGQYLSYNRLKRCAQCGGRGRRPDAATTPCPKCWGRGEVRLEEGHITLTLTCSRCKGEGFVVKEVCPACRGEGRGSSPERLRIKVPPGVEDGMRLKLKGKGDEGVDGGGAGDLIVGVRIKRHPIFQRRGQDITFDFPINFVQAALGAEVAIPTLDGKGKLKVPAGIQSGTVLRLKGMGMHKLGKRARGDAQVRVLVETPVRLSARQREILREFEKLSPERGNPLKGSFLRKLRDIFD